jgi:catechol 2,3-dioxygenase-like lactoylglutathione lyase family enzyme
MFHHVALATHDAAATHDFYTRVMGFHLVKVVVSPTPEGGGFSKHFFYATDGSPNGETGMMAFWEIHDTKIGNDFPVDVNAAAGLPWWVNHIAFDAPSMEALHTHRDRWRAHGHTVIEIDHDFCVSIYLKDPSGNMVEFCHSVRPFTDEEKARAAAIVASPNPDLDDHHAKVTVWKPFDEEILGASR